VSEQKPIKHADLARHWGVSRPLVCKFAKERSMPAFTSLAAADTWREVNAPPRKRKSTTNDSSKIGAEVSEKKSRASDTSNNDATSSGSGTGGRETSKGTSGAWEIDVETFIRTDKDFDSLMIEQAERVPQIAFGLLELKQRTGVAHAIQDATANWHQAVKASASVRTQFLDLQERTRALIQLDEVMDVVGTELQALRSFLDKLGTRYGAAANPDDPQRAIDVINGAIDEVYRRIDMAQDVARKELDA